MESLIQKIISKKELKSIDISFATKVFEQTKNENSKLYKKLEEKEFNERSKEYKEFKKIVRQKLRSYFGSFNTTISKKTKEKSKEELLKKHLSTRERYDHIEEFSDFLGETKSILDLGCGYNPFFYNNFKGNPKYLASDISSDLKYIQEFFDEEKIKGNTKILDLTIYEDLELLAEISKEYETCLMLKLLDPLEKQKRNISKEILNKINSKIIIVSFSTMSIGGKTKIKSKREWFYNLIRGKILEEKEIGPEKYIKILNKE
ncbi:MAG: hypothetical protein ACMXX7_02970 [Candidatus Woesearchaeota archaeon]